MTKLPLRHLSIRVPWHDSAWNGGVCRHPEKNAACLILPRIREERKPDEEAPLAGKRISDLPQNQWPPCISERATFMAPFAITRKATQPYSRTSNLHRHMLPTDHVIPPFTAAAIPFGWMEREKAAQHAAELGIDYRPEREPSAPEWLAKNTWVQNHDNQRAMLDAFATPVAVGQSLVFFYAKQTPLAEDERRVIVGVGRVSSVASVREYDYSEQGGLRAYLWERNISHSIRSDNKDGFLLPYQAILERAAADPTIDPSQFVAFAPEEHHAEFSFAAEHVTNDAAIAALLSCKGAVERARTLIEGPWDQVLRWIDARIGELWKLRGAYPGLGAALTALGLEQGHLLAHAIVAELPELADPWPAIDQAMRNPQALPADLARQFTPTMRRAWIHLTERLPERFALLRLIARADLSAAQATRFFVQEERTQAGIACGDADVLRNPYLLYELDRGALDAIGFGLVDRAVLPDPAVREQHPLPSPSTIEGAIDPRRVRALLVSQLEQAALEGHTLHGRTELVNRIRSLNIEPPCPLTGDLLDVIEGDLAPVVTVCTLQDGSPAYQLDRLDKIRGVIRTAVLRRVAGQRHRVAVDWRARLDAVLDRSGSYTPRSPADAEAEGRAREEKAAALKELAESRFSVLIGPAGTGKTTLLEVLCAEASIKQGGILALAPTGKARVRLQGAIRVVAQTIAQFLLPSGRYNEQTGVYRLGGQKATTTAKTVIVDEASMLTEEQLGALIDALPIYDRLILVGDPRQLPPIGAGRPFLDIVNQLAPADIENRFPRIAAGYAEITERRRFVVQHADQALDDLQLAEWFSGRAPGPGDDDIFDKIAWQPGNASGRVRFVEWSDEADLKEKLLATLVDELQLGDLGNTAGFDVSLGGTPVGNYVFFNKGAAVQSESWQLLSATRGMSWGTVELNRLIKQTFRQGAVDWAKRSKREPKGKSIPKITEPRGPEEIVYGDKVICLRNHRRKWVAPEPNALKYVANGEIGMVVGQFRPKSETTWNPWLTKVEFGSQPGFAYDFSGGDFSENNSFLELAYAITVHRAQGSEFGRTFLVLPDSGRMLSRELLYTALTRQREKLIILHQGPLSKLKEFASAQYSESARRLTNLFHEPIPVMVGDRVVDARLIHRSGKGEPMRSKSEVIIADALASARISYVYEQPLQSADGQTRYPDFTVEDADSGVVYYWEHLGMLDRADYRERWERKLIWYRNQDILPHEEGGGSQGTLIITRDDAAGGFDSYQVRQLIASIWP